MNLVSALSIAFALAAADAPKPARYLVHIDLLQGDPSGSLQAGTIKYVSRTQMRLDGGQPDEFAVSFFVPPELAAAGVESRLGGKLVVEAVGPNRVRVRGTTELVDFTEVGDGEAIVKSERAFFARERNLGRTIQVRMGKDADRETWAEIKVEDGTAAVPSAPTPYSPRLTPADARATPRR